MHLFDSTNCDEALSKDWRASALITATLFLNLPFWEIYGGWLWMQRPIGLFAAIVAVVGVLIAVFFYFGPALAMRRAGAGWLGTIERSLGRGPAFLVRLCAIWFLVAWMASLFYMPIWWGQLFRGREFPSHGWSVALNAALLLLLFWTGTRSLTSSVTQAKFTNKLACAVLLAALIRVHEGWAGGLRGVSASQNPPGLDLWRGLSWLVLAAAPLALLSTAWAGRLETRKQLVLAGLVGFAVPVSAVLLLVGFIKVATWYSPHYQPSLEPDIAMALWGKAARSAVPPVMMIAAITMFGAVRFGARGLRELAPAGWIRERWAWIPVGVVAVVGAKELPLEGLWRSLSVAATCLIGVAGVLSGDAASGRRYRAGARWFDGVGAVSLVIGMSVAAVVGYWAEGADLHTWWDLGLLPAYGTAFVVSVLGGTMQRFAWYGGGHGFEQKEVRDGVGGGAGNDGGGGDAGAGGE